MWQIFPAALLLFLLARGMATRIKSARLSKKPAREFQAALEEIRAKAGNQVEFYREAAKFVTTWKGAEGFEEIFETRDEICFRPDAPSAPVPEAERNRVIKRLESLSPMLLSALLFLLQFSPLGAGERDPAIERARLLQELSETPSPEHFYNLALCEKELDRGGKAALWAYRYEAQGGDASALLQELPGLKVPPKEGLDWLSYFPRSLYGQVALAGGWALAIFLVCFFSRHSHPRLFLRGLSGSIAALALPLGGAAFLLYPDEIGFGPLSQLAVVSAEDAERASL